MAVVAQLVEHWIVAPGVEGSIPFHRPKYQGAASSLSPGLMALSFGEKDKKGRQKDKFLLPFFIGPVRMQTSQERNH